MKNGGSPGGKNPADDLTWREQEVLILLAGRLSNREIADQLHLAESTVKDYVGKILSKLFVSNRREAVERAKDLGLLDRERKTTAVPKTQLPTERTPFVGRKQEILEIQRQLGKTRLLSLTGPGGIGKTRLALKAAEGLTGDFEDGVFFVPLAPIRSVKDLIQTIAEGLKFPIATHEDPQHQLLRYLRNRQLLLVIDNFEHLLDGVGIVSEILQAAPAVKVLATTRERLNLQSETMIQVGGLAFPGQPGSIALTYDAILLFLQSASKVRPGFEPSPGELDQVASICQFVGGMPLAIELAAAWLHVLNVDEIAQELQKDIDILVTDVRDAPERHRSIRAVFDHSWSMLDRTEQEVFMRLSVFRGGFTREAARQVAGASLHHLAGFVNKSFLSHDPDSGRFEAHELLRQYAQEQPGETPAAHLPLQEAHAAFYADFMQQNWGRLKCSQQMLALSEIEADIENVRAAWRFYLDQRKPAQIWKLIYGTWYVYWIRWWNHAGMELFAQAATAFQGEDDEEARAIRALAMAFQGYFMAWLGLAKQGYEIAGQAVAILERLDHPRALAFAYDSLAVNAYFLYRYTEEIQAIDKMVEIARALDDPWLLAFTLFAQGMAALVQEDFARARQLAEKNLDLYEKVGDVIGSTTPLIVLGHASLALGELEEAREFYLRCLQVSQETGFYYATQTASKYLCKVALSLGKVAEAERYLVQSLRITKEIGFVRDLVNLLYEYARLQVARGNLEGAVELLEMVIRHPASHLYRMLEGRIRDSARELLAELEAGLPSEGYSAALERGRELELDPVILDLVGSRRR